MRVVLLATMAVWGANLSVVKMLIEHLEPLVVSVLRMIVAALALLAVVRWQGLQWRGIRRDQWLALLGCAALMFYLNQLLFTEGMARTVASNAALIIALNPLMSTLMAAVFLGDKLTPARLAGVVMGFGGVAAVVLHRPGVALGTAGLGDALIFGSVITWVSGGVLVRRIARELDPMLISTVATLLGTLMLSAHLLLRPTPLQAHWDQMTPLLVLLLVLSGLLANAVGGVVWNRGLVQLGVARTSLYAYWVPIFGVAFAVMLLGEPLTVWHAVGLAAVLGGTWLGTRSH